MYEISTAIRRTGPEGKVPDRSHHPSPGAPETARHCEHGIEHHRTEGAVVMLAFAMHLPRTVPGIQEIAIHPDGEHGKRLGFEPWLAKGHENFGNRCSSGHST